VTREIEGPPGVDFTYWGNVPYWKIEEATALILGHDPEEFGPSSRIGLQNLPLSREYNKLQELAHRATQTGQLPLHPSPQEFLAWARRNSLSFPPELEKAVFLDASNIIDWQDRHEKLLKLYEKTKVELAGLRETELLNKGETVSAKERSSLLKLVIGMAVAGYRYDPQAKRNEASAEIAGDLARLGIPLDPDTVRKWLREAAQYLPHDHSTEV
jgi:hypothetical protein